MKMKFYYKSIILELILVLSISFLFSLFAKDFSFWLVFCLILTLIWHRRNEFKLLDILYPNYKSKNVKNILAQTSPSQIYLTHKSRKEKVKMLRLLSKLNKNTQYLLDGVIICQADGDIFWCNNAAQEILSFYWNKRAQKNIFNVIFYPEFKAYFYNRANHQPLVVLTNDQRYIEINVNEYDTSQYLVIMRDITQIIRLLHSRQTFLANMNHELRTPLTVLQGYLELLEDDLKSNKIYAKAIQAMTEQSQRMSHLLNQLSLLAKIEYSTNQHHPVDVSQMIDTLQYSSQLLCLPSQQIDFTIEPNLKVMGDEGQLQSATSNLIYNAIRHSGENTQIQVKWESVPEGAQFSVIDNGIGISEEHIPHLTERFYRVDSSRNNQTGGSGLGLAIVKHALEQHNTQLQIQSKKGKGSQFSFVIKKKYLV